MTNDYNTPRRNANALMTYANQIDPLVPANKAALDVWAYRLGNVNFEQAQAVIVEYYANQQPGERTPITPRGIASRIDHRRRQAIGRSYYCQQHDGERSETCKTCLKEVSEGTRQPAQQGQDIRHVVPPPAELKPVLRAVGTALKDVNEGPEKQ